MAEFGAAATLSVEVPDSELRAARAEIEDELGDLTVNVEASAGGSGQRGQRGGVPMADGGMDVPTLLNEEIDLLEQIEEHLDEDTSGGAGGGDGGGGFFAGGVASRLLPLLAVGGAIGGGAVAGNVLGQNVTSEETQGEFVDATGFGVHPDDRPDHPGAFEEGGVVDRGFAPQEDSPASRLWDRLFGSDGGSGGGGDRFEREPADPESVREATRRDQGAGASVRNRQGAPDIIVEDNTTVNVDAVAELEDALDRKKDDIARDVQRKLENAVSQGLRE